MANIQERTAADAEQDFLKYANKEAAFLIEKYADYQNQKTNLMDKVNKTQ